VSLIVILKTLDWGNRLVFSGRIGHGILGHPGQIAFLLALTFWPEDVVMVPLKNPVPPLSGAQGEENEDCATE
jgi:hypothetical protein